jgi:AAA+ ATPase superfamily predicted ATPase
MVIITMIIPREEEKRLREINKWVLVYGRRKTGTTFLVKTFLEHDEYFFVKRDRSIIIGSSESVVAYDAFIVILGRMLNEGKTAVVDEFHRLGADFSDYLHYRDKKGKVILISSTLHLAKNLVAEKSPLLGLFAEFPLGLLKIEDVLKALPKGTDKKEGIELAVLMSEPLLIGYYKTGMTSAELCQISLSKSKFLVSALVGETFNEEERILTNVYAGILQAIAAGKRISTEISSFLFSRKLIPKDNPGSIQPYLQNLIEIGLIKRTPVINRKTFAYEHVSPLIEMFYYADEKYNLGEIALSRSHFSTMFGSMFPRIVERYIRSFLARKLGLLEGVVTGKDYDVDGCLMRFKKCKIALEVKWKKEVSKEDVLRAEEVLAKVESKRKLLFVPDKGKVRHRSDKIEIVDISDFI